MHPDPGCNSASAVRGLYPDPRDGGCAEPGHLTAAQERELISEVRLFRSKLAFLETGRATKRSPEESMAISSGVSYGLLDGSIASAGRLNPSVDETRPDVRRVAAGADLGTAETRHRS